MKKWWLRGFAAIAVLGLLAAVLLLRWAGGAGGDVPPFLASWLSTSASREALPTDPTTAQIQGLAPVTVERLPSDVVALAMSRSYNQGSEGLLVRELVRQAVLIAARDELGLRTRDASLREFLPDVDARSLGALEAIVAIDDDRRASINLAPAGNEIDGKWEHRLGPLSGDLVTSVATEAEAASRGVFVWTLGELGYRRPTEGAGRGAAEEPQAELCDRIDLVSQYAAVRGWHGAIRGSGETPTRLAGLVRGYALLGLLSRHHWSAATKAFQARSLLYAERLVRSSGASADALRWRAFARASVGLPTAAADDLEQAKRSADGNDVPVWVEIVGAFAKGDAEKLAELADSPADPDRAFARLLRFMDARWTRGPVEPTRVAALSALDAEPNSAWAVAALMGSEMPLGTRRTEQQEALESSGAWLYGPLSASGLGLEVDRQAVARDEGRSRRTLTEGLLSDETLRGDRNEPSLVALGRVIEEEGLCQAHAIISVDRFALGVDSDQLIARTMPWLWHHPFRKYIETAYLWDRQTAGLRIGNASLTINGHELVPAMSPMIDQLKANRLVSDAADTAMRRSLDEVWPDLAWRLERRDGSEDELRRLAQTLGRVTPDRAFSVAFLLRHDRELAARRAEEWERRFGDSPAVLAELAEVYVDRMRYPDAIRCLEAKADVMADWPTFRRLAEVYRDAGNEEMFLTTLEDAISMERQGLEDAYGNNMIANHYMWTNRFEAAMPYAAAAAGSYSGWGLQTAAYCREALGDFEGAERLQRAVSERYRDSGVDWYLWCMRTGRGDAAAARAAADEVIREWSAALVDPSYRPWAALAQYLDGRKEEALATYQIVAQDGDAYRKLMAALVADELGLAEVRDVHLREAVDAGDDGDLTSSILARAFRDDLAGPPLDPVRLDTQILATNSYEQPVAGGRYLVGRYLENRGRVEEAVAFYEKVAPLPRYDVAFATLAARGLIRHGRTLPGLRGSVLAERTGRIYRRFNEAWRRSKSQPELALPLIDDVLAEDPKFLLATSGRMRVLTTLERFEEAARDCEAVLTVVPQSPTLLLARADLAEKAGDVDRAVAGREAILAMKPRLDVANEAHAGLARLFASSTDPRFRDPAAALQHAESLVVTNVMPEWNRQRVTAMALGAAGSFEKAVPLAEAAVAKAPASSRPWMEYQLARYRRGEAYVRPANWWRATPVEAGPVEAGRP